MPSSRIPLISIRNMTTRIGSDLVFRNTSWTIHQNEHWAVLGQTGSGKTILANVLNRRLPLISGNIIFYFDPLNLPEGRPYLLRNEVLTLSPETQRDFLRPYALYHQARWHSFEGLDAPTVSELLSSKSIEHHSPFETTPFTIHEDLYRQRRDWVVALFHLDYLLERRIIHLSHGESRKVFIARLLMQNPRLLILDDPYSGLDQESREYLSSGIDNLLQSTLSPQILLLSSKVEDIPDNIDHLLLVDQMQIIDRGKREEVISRLHPSWFHGVHSKNVSINIENSSTLSTILSEFSRRLSNNNLLESRPVIQMNMVTIQYDNINILKDVNWLVNPGERWVLRGHNGAGKSTLLSLILADNPMAYANDISIFGQKRGHGESIWEIKQNIGWVSPELQIFYQEDSSCLEVVCSGFYDSIGLHQACSKPQVETAGAWLNALGIDQMASIPFFTLSAGQQRLVLLARALVKYPSLLVLDEPCQGLDDEHRRIFIQLLDHLCSQSPLTMIYITHDLNDRPASITHELILDHGLVTKSRVVKP